MERKFMTRDTKVIVKVGLIDDYEVKIGKLQEELSEVKARLNWSKGQERKKPASRKKAKVTKKS